MLSSGLKKNVFFFYFYRLLYSCVCVCDSFTSLTIEMYVIMVISLQQGMLVSESKYHLAKWLYVNKVHVECKNSISFQSSKVCVCVWYINVSMKNKTVKFSDKYK